MTSTSETAHAETMFLIRGDDESLSALRERLAGSGTTTEDFTLAGFGAAVEHDPAPFRGDRIETGEGWLFLRFESTWDVVMTDLGIPLAQAFPTLNVLAVGYGGDHGTRYVGACAGGTQTGDCKTALPPGSFAGERELVHEMRTRTGGDRLTYETFAEEAPWEPTA